MKKIILLLLISLSLFPQANAQVAIADPLGIGPVEEDYDWWREARFGIFIHWNPSSMLELKAGSWNRSSEKRKDYKSVSTNKSDFKHTPEAIADGSYLEWKRGKSVPQDIYDNLFHGFNPYKFDAVEWVKTFKDAGAGYIVLTTKHHDGFCMFDSKDTEYDIMSTPFGRDIAKELSDACHAAGIKVIWYYSKADWYDTRYDTGNPGRYEEYMLSQIDELTSNYGEIKGIWWDGGKIFIDPTKTAKILNKNQPGYILNGRGPKDMPGLSFGTPEQKLGGFNKGRPWETCAIMQGEGWFWNGGINIKSTEVCLRLLIDSSIGDGNLLLDFGGTPDGEIYEPIKQTYLNMGKWLKKNGESIYGTRGGPYKPTHWGGSTHKGNKIYLHVTQKWPKGELVLPALPAEIVSISTLSGNGKPAFEQTKNSVTVKLDAKDHEEVDTVIILEIKTDAKNIRPIEAVKIERISLNKIATASSEKISGSKGPAGSVILQSYEIGLKKTLHFGEENSADKKGKKKKGKMKLHISKENLEKFPWTNKHMGHIWRFWMADPTDKQPWIEVDLGEVEKVNRISISERFSCIKKHEIQYLKGDKWITIAKGGELGVVSYEFPKEIKTQKIRLQILEWKSDIEEEGPAVHSIDIY